MRRDKRGGIEASKPSYVVFKALKVTPTYHLALEESLSSHTYPHSYLNVGAIRKFSIKWQSSSEYKSGSGSSRGQTVASCSTSSTLFSFSIYFSCAQASGQSTQLASWPQISRTHIVFSSFFLAFLFLIIFLFFAQLIFVTLTPAKIVVAKKSLP